MKNTSSTHTPPASTSSSTFSSLPLHAATKKALARLKFTEATPIQAQTLPHTLKGRDLIGFAETGSGKTAAFCIPILEKLLSDPQAHALILAPTRELASQIEKFWIELVRDLGHGSNVSGGSTLRPVLAVGGLSLGYQQKLLRKHPRVIIATPGRLIDHLETGAAKLRKVAILVLDEADRMLDMGFAPQLSAILEELPGNDGESGDRQTFLFSATATKEMEEMTHQYLNDPIRVVVGEISRANTQVTQKAVQIDSTHAKAEVLLDLINATPGQALVFARTQDRVDRLTRYLEEFGVGVAQIHAGRTQAQRNAALQAFRQGQIQVLVGTDVASRGIDVPGLAQVVNYDLPRDPEDYIHRIGRTGRAGATGLATSIVTRDDKGQWIRIERLLKKTGSKLPEMTVLPSNAQHQAQTAKHERKPVTVRTVNEATQEAAQAKVRVQVTQDSSEETGGEAVTLKTSRSEQPRSLRAYDRPRSKSFEPRGEGRGFARGERRERPSFGRDDRGEGRGFPRGERRERPSFGRDDRGEGRGFARENKPFTARERSFGDNRRGGAMAPRTPRFSRDLNEGGGSDRRRSPRSSGGLQLKMGRGVRVES